MANWNARILVPTDGTAFADRILNNVRPLLGKRSEVALLHVYPATLFGDPEAAQPTVLRTKRRLARLQGLVEGWGARARSAVMVGEPAERILDYAAKYRPTLIAMATHGRAGVERWIQGSVAESVLRASEQPVFLASQKALESPRRARIKRVLVPLDGSDRSAAALPQARKLAHRNGAELLLLHIVDIRSAASPSVGDAARTRLDAKHQLEAIVAEDSSVPTRIVLGTGKPASAILRAIKRERADVVVMSSHGRTGVRRSIFGSVAEEVVRRAPCPILVTRGVQRAARKERAPKATASR